MPDSSLEARMPRLPKGVLRGRVLETPPEPLPSGDAALDTLLGGGFPRGRLSEIVGPCSSGRTTIAWRVLASATRRGEIAGLVDGADRFDPARAEAAGILLEKLLWVHPRSLPRALRGAEILLDTKGLGLVVVDLGDEPSSVRGEELAPAWPRLAHRAALSGTPLLLIARERLAGSRAHLGLSLSTHRFLWSGEPENVRLFDGVESRAEIVRLRHGTPGRQSRLFLPG